MQFVAVIPWKYAKWILVDRVIGYVAPVIGFGLLCLWYYLSAVLMLPGFQSLWSLVGMILGGVALISYIAARIYFRPVIPRAERRRLQAVEDARVARLARDAGPRQDSGLPLAPTRIGVYRR